MSHKEYWQNKADRFKLDIQHVNEEMGSTSDPAKLHGLRKLKQMMVNEIMICMEAVEKFS